MNLDLPSFIGTFFNVFFFFGGGGGEALKNSQHKKTAETIKMKHSTGNFWNIPQNIHVYLPTLTINMK